MCLRGGGLHHAARPCLGRSFFFSLFCGGDKHPTAHTSIVSKSLLFPQESRIHGIYSQDKKPWMRMGLDCWSRIASHCVLSAMQFFAKTPDGKTVSLPQEKAMVLAALRQDGSLLEHVHDSFGPGSLRKDNEVVLTAVRQNGLALQHARLCSRLDKEIVLEAVRQDGMALQHAFDKSQDDRSIVLAAVKQNAWSLQFASEALRNDKGIVLEAVRRNGLALELASNDLRNDSEVVLEAVQQNRLASEFARSCGPFKPEPPEHPPPRHPPRKRRRQ